MKGIGRLRDIYESELELMRCWRNCPDIRSKMYTRHEIRSDEHRSWWAAVQSRNDQRYFMYELDNEPSGIVSFTGIDKINNNASWAFYASPESSNGTGTKMEILALDYAFFSIRLHKLYCEVLASNTQVIKLHHKFGFRTEGVFREQHKIDDNFIDIYRLGLLQPEWCEHRPGIEKKISRLIKY